MTDIAKPVRSVEQLEELVGMQQALISLLEDGAKNSNALIGALKKRSETQERQLEALEQVEMASRAMQQTAEHYACLVRATLVYILERGEKERGWLRLWEALPQEQKDVYLQEAKDWIGKQPSHIDPELLARMKPAPEKE